MLLVSANINIWILVCLISKSLFFVINYLLVFTAASKILLKNFKWEPKLFLMMEFGEWMSIYNYHLWLSASGICKAVDLCWLFSLGRYHGLGTLVYDSLKTKIAIIQGSDYGIDAGENIKRTGQKTGRTRWLVDCAILLLLFFINLFIYLFIGCVGSSLLCAASGGHSSLRCAGFSLWWLLLSWSTGCRRMGCRSCGTQAQ